MPDKSKRSSGKGVTKPVREPQAKPSPTALAAAAPDLYAALDRFVDRAQSWHNFHHDTYIQCDELCEAIEPGRAALAKARGEISTSDTPALPSPNTKTPGEPDAG